jgi:hypothetical protein
MKNAMKNMVGLQTLLIVTFLSFACREANASQKKEGRITQVIQDVKLLPGSAAPRPAAVNDEVRIGTAVRTGQDSRTELTFSDQTLTRLGANSVFSFSGEGKAFDLGQGSILMQVPPNGSTATVKTAAVTAAISGGTALFGVGPPMKFMVLEGKGTFYPPGHPEGITLHGGEMITLTPDGQLIGPTGFDVKKVLESAELLLPPFTDLANLWLIWQVITWQEADQSNGFKHSPKDPTEIETRDQSAASSESTPPESPTPTPATPTPTPATPTPTPATPTPTPATPTPTPATPTPTPAALKYGTPPTITSPVPYVINSSTVINTDPTITTNDVIDEGRIYRNPTADGPRADWMFGSTSAFDTTSGFASGPDSVHMDNMAVFKFTSLQITGNPTVITTGDNAVGNLGLIGVNGITTSGGGETLTFDGVSMLLLATQNGSITLGGEFSFSGMDRMHIYARGTGSNLTIGSAITTNNDLRLYSEGTVQVNGDASTINFSSFSGGDWLNGSGLINANGIYITSLGNITLDGEDLPDLPDGGGDISLRATNTLTVTVTGGTNTREHFDLFGATINLTSDTPVVLTLLATNPSINAGAGGIQASNVGLVGANLLLQSDGDINIYSVGVPGFIVDGTIDAGGLFHAVANVDTGFLSTGTSAFVGGDLSLSVAIIGTTLDVVGRLSASFVSAGGDVTVGTLAVLDLTTPGILTETTGGIHPLVFDNDDLDDGAAAQHTFTVASIVSPNGIDFSGNQFGGIDGFSSGGLLTINATTITFGDGGIASANFNGADAGAFDDEPFTPAGGGSGGTFVVNTTDNITTVLDFDITATTGLNAPGDLGFSGNGGNVTLNSSGGTVTVDSLIQVSSNDDDPEGSEPEPIRRSASGGNITLHSGLTTGLGVSIGGDAQLLSLLNHNAPGPGGTITITTEGADIHMGEFFGAFLIADRGTIAIYQTAAGTDGTSLIEIYNTLLRAETISIASSGDFELGLEGFVIVEGVTLSLTAENDLTMDGFFSGETAVESDGNVTIFGANVSSLDDVTISRGNGGRDSGVNISLTAGTAITVNGTLSLTTYPDGLTSGGNIFLSAPTIGITGDTVLTTDTLENTGIGANITVTGDLTTQALIAHVLVGQFAGRPSGPLGGFGETITLTSGGNITVTAPNGLNLSTSGTFGASELFVITADFGEILTGGNITLTVGLVTDPANLLSDAPFDMEIDTSGGSKFRGHIGTGANILAIVHGNFTVSDLFVAIFNDGGRIDNGGNTSVTVDNDLAAAGGITMQVINNDGGAIGTGGDVSLSVLGSIALTDELIMYIDSSGGGTIASGGNVNLEVGGTTMLNGPLVLEVDTYDGGTITTGGNVTGHFFGDVTNTNGDFHSLNFFIVNGGNIFVGPLGGGTIGTGGNIDVTFDGNVNTHPSGIFGSLAAEIANAGGSIGTGGNISVKIGTALNPLSGNLNVAGLFVYTQNTDGGHITDGGNITFDARGAVTTTAQAVFELLNNGGTIESDPVVYVHAASFNIGGLLLADIDNTNGNIGEGGSGSLSLHSDGAITVALGMWVNGAVIAGGDVTAGTIASTDVTVTSATGSINALAGGITRFRHLDGDGSTANVLHTLTAFKVTSGGGINFNGFNADGDLSMATDAGSLTINANSLSIGSPLVAVGPLVLGSGDIMGPVTFNGGDGSSTFDPASGGTFTVNTTGDIGDIEVNTDIEATTGHFQPALSATPAGFGGTVNLNSTHGTVTVNSRIEVSSAEPASTIAPFRQSASGGNISITSGKTGGVAINIGTGARLLSLLDASAPGPGGTITISATGNASAIDIDNLNGDPGEITADRGTIDINHQGNNGFITISNANMHADVIKIQMFGENGILTISGGNIDANSALTLYAAGSSGSIVFNTNVTLSSNSAAIIAANTVTINDGVTVFIDSTNPALVYANVANYSATNGGNGLTTGSFGGPGAPTTTQPFPPPGPVIAASTASGSNAVTTPILVSQLAQAGTQNSQSGGVLLAASQSAAKRIVPPQGASGQRGVVSRRLETPSNLPREHRSMAASRTTARTSGSAANVSNSAQLLSLLEAPPGSGGRINFVPRPRSHSQKSAGTPTTGLNSSTVGATYGNTTTISEPNATQTAPPRNIGGGPGANTQVDNRTSSATTGRPGGALSY